MLGIAVVLIPNFMGGKVTSNGDIHIMEASSDSGSGLSEIFWVVVMVISCIPMCLSSVYKEQALGEVEIDVVYLNGWVAVFQFLYSLPLTLPSAYVIHMGLSDILPNIVGGMKCWLGINSIMEDTSFGSKDDCSQAPLFFTLYLIFNIIYNVLMVVILKLGSSNILWMASTLIVPLGDVAFSLKFMPNRQPMTVYDILGLLCIMIGLVFYRFMAQIIAVFEKIRNINKTVPLEVTKAEKRARRIRREIEEKQTRFIGLNQADHLQSLIDTRIWKAQKRSLFRSDRQIRGELLVRLGIPPSPMITMSPSRSRLGLSIPSPSQSRKSAKIEIRNSLSPDHRNTALSYGTNSISTGKGISNLSREKLISESV
jgi:hypothetical protein